MSYGEPKPSENERKITRRKFLTFLGVGGGAVIAEAQFSPIRKLFNFLRQGPNTSVVIPDSPPQPTNGEYKVPEVEFGAEIEKLKQKIAEIKTLETQIMTEYGHDGHNVIEHTLVAHIRAITENYNQDAGTLKPVDLYFYENKVKATPSPQQSSEFVLDKRTPDVSRDVIRASTNSEEDLYNPYIFATYLHFYDGMVKKGKNRLTKITFNGEGNFVYNLSSNVHINATNPEGNAQGRLQTLLSGYGALTHETQHALSPSMTFATEEGYGPYSAMQCLEYYQMWLQFIKDNSKFVKEYFFEVEGDGLHEFLAAGAVGRVVEEMLAISNVNYMMGNEKGWNWPGSEEKLRKASDGQGKNLEATVLKTLEAIRYNQFDNKPVNSEDIQDIRRNLGSSVLLFAREKIKNELRYPKTWQLILTLLNDEVRKYYTSTQPLLKENFEKALYSPIEELDTQFVINLNNRGIPLDRLRKEIAEELKADLTHPSPGFYEATEWLYFFEYFFREKGALIWPSGKIDSKTLEELRSYQFENPISDEVTRPEFKQKSEEFVNALRPASKYVNHAYEGNVCYVIQVIHNSEANNEEMIMYKVIPESNAVSEYHGKVYVTDKGEAFSIFDWRNGAWRSGSFTFSTNDNVTYEFSWGEPEIANPVTEEDKEKELENTQAELQKYANEKIQPGTEYMKTIYDLKSTTLYVVTVRVDGNKKKMTMYKLKSIFGQVSDENGVVYETEPGGTFLSQDFDPSNTSNGKFSFRVRDKGNQEFSLQFAWNDSQIRLP
jgi:hypothetical protein